MPRRGRQARLGRHPPVTPLLLECPARPVLLYVALLPAGEASRKLGARQAIALREGLRRGLIADERRDRVGRRRRPA
eukprot:scaffold5843_cov125-Isochrysis_galbana.AAC.10